MNRHSNDYRFMFKNLSLPLPALLLLFLCYCFTLVDILYWSMCLEMDLKDKNTCVSSQISNQVYDCAHDHVSIVRRQWEKWVYECEWERMWVCASVRVCVYVRLYIKYVWKMAKNKEYTFLDCSLFFLLTKICPHHRLLATEVQRKCVNTYNARFFFLLFYIFFPDIFSSIRCGMIRTKKK